MSFLLGVNEIIASREPRSLDRGIWAGTPLQIATSFFSCPVWLVMPEASSSLPIFIDTLSISLLPMDIGHGHKPTGIVP